MNSAVAIDRSFLNSVNKIVASYLRMVHRNDRDDYMQEVYIRVWKKISDNRGRSLPNSLIRKIARNVFLNYVKRRYVTKKIFEDRNLEDFVDGFDEEDNELVYVRIVAHRDVRFELVELKCFVDEVFSNREREILKYMIGEGLGQQVKDVAERFGVSSPYVSVVWSKFVKKVGCTKESTSRRKYINRRVKNTAH